MRYFMYTLGPLYIYHLDETRSYYYTIDNRIVTFWTFTPRSHSRNLGLSDVEELI